MLFVIIFPQFVVIWVIILKTKDHTLSYNVNVDSLQLYYLCIYNAVAGKMFRSHDPSYKAIQHQSTPPDTSVSTLVMSLA